MRFNPISKLIALLPVPRKGRLYTLLIVNYEIESLISFVLCSSQATSDTAGFISRKDDFEALTS